ncbi:MAG: hypothetical protein AB7G87_01105 [Clostridia bacterium]
MISAIAYPNYRDIYYYIAGDSFILLRRTKDEKTIYTRILPFDTPEEAREYFDNNCGA